MSMSDISCGLDYCHVSDVSACITETMQFKYKFAAFPIVHPRYRRHHVRGETVVPGFTRSDMLLSPQDWTVRIVGKLSPYLDVDAPSLVARQFHEDAMNEELLYCRGLGLPAIMVTLHGRENSNLARIVQTFFANSHNPSLIWARVPMMCEQKTRGSEAGGDEEDDEAWAEPWRWWSGFHELMEWDKRMGVVLELSADLPPERLLLRWLGEPVKCIIIPTSLFHSNKKGYPVLPRMHQLVVLSLVSHESQVLISGAHRSQFHHYTQYLQHLWDRRPHQPDDPMLSYARGWEDYLQTPLQPLADNLDTHTYNVFEKDPVKYNQYQKAIAHALLDLQKKESQKKTEESNNNSKSQLEVSIENISNTLKSQASLSPTEIKENKETPFLDSRDAIVPEGKTLKQEDTGNGSTKVYTVMVLGAGRGPLIRAALNAADITKTKIKVLAIEKNPCAVVALIALARELWYNRGVQVLAGDMRHIKLTEPADIIVSELLGSWGDNELSPECLDGAAGLLRPGGISIPSQYTSYVAPITSPRLWAAAKSVPVVSTNQQEKNLETLWVVYMQNKYDIADTKPVFTFDHPAVGVKDNEGNIVRDNDGCPRTDNRRSATLTWEVEQDSVMHGFGGYFDSTLYGKENISIVPSSHSPGMISWFPVFIPIKNPLRVVKGDIITGTFWRCVSARRVWYEWVVKVGNRTTSIHNPNGRSSEMLL